MQKVSSMRTSIWKTAFSLNNITTSSVSIIAPISSPFGSTGTLSRCCSRCRQQAKGHRRWLPFQEIPLRMLPRSPVTTSQMEGTMSHLDISFVQRADASSKELTRSEERQVVVASTVGTLFEWYDFFIYGSLVAFMSSVLFPPSNPTAALLASLGALAAGFLVRPIGALLFGHLGDRFGRKVTF